MVIVDGCGLVGTTSVGLPVIHPASFAAVPLHLTHWSIKVRPQGWGLKFCSNPLAWEHVSSFVPTSDLRLCEAIGDSKRPPFRLVCSSLTHH